MEEKSTRRCPGSMLCAQDDESGMRGAMDMLVHHRKPKKPRRKGDVRSRPPESLMFGAGDSLSPPGSDGYAPSAETEKKEDLIAIFSSITSIPETITLALSVPVHHPPDSRRTEDQGRKRPSP
jgi:hypothetical protein